MPSHEEIWGEYKKCLQEKRFDDWGLLWAEEDSVFEVALPLQPYNEEKYTSRKNIVALVGGNSFVESFRIYDDELSSVDGEDCCFVRCSFEAIAVSGYQYKTPMVLQISFSGEESGNIIRRIIEYPDPRARAAFFEELQLIEKIVTVSKSLRSK